MFCGRLIADRLEADEQTAAVRGLLWRLLPPVDAAKFRLRVDDGPGDSDVSSGDNAADGEEQQPAASFEARSDGKCVHVRATTGVEVAAGILHFLKYRCCHYLWGQMTCDGWCKGAVCSQSLSEWLAVARHWLLNVAH